MNIKAGCSDSTHWQFLGFIKRHADNVALAENEPINIVKEQKHAAAKPYKVAHLTAKQVLSYIGRHRNLKKVQDVATIEFQKNLDKTLPEKLKMVATKFGVQLNDISELIAKKAIKNFEISFENFYKDRDNMRIRLRNFHEADVPEHLAWQIKRSEDDEFQLGTYRKYAVLRRDIHLSHDLGTSFFSDGVDPEEEYFKLPRGLVIQIAGIEQPTEKVVARCFAACPKEWGCFFEFYIPFDIKTMSIIVSKETATKINELAWGNPSNNQILMKVLN
ncbi:MAG: hypothetical protein PUP93_33735 [Rhizonema sp. NSF051]|nr:hypothetical protein [Rhizonema sp. NSF051]